MSSPITENLPNTSYYGNFLSQAEADSLFEHLCELSRLTSMLSLDIPGSGLMTYDFGKLMFLEEEVFQSGRFVETAWGPLAVFTSELQQLKDRIEAQTGIKFGTCVAIYYPDGNSWVDYHSDKPAFGDTDIIASMSLGAERSFALREKSERTIFSKVLEHGSLLVMEDGCQDKFEHSLLKEPSCNTPRINLTFRKLGFQ